MNISAESPLVSSTRVCWAGDRTLGGVGGDGAAGIPPPPLGKEGAIIDKRFLERSFSLGRIGYQGEESAL
jgi:hypothetical protein